MKKPLKESITTKLKALLKPKGGDSLWPEPQTLVGLLLLGGTAFILQFQQTSPVEKTPTESSNHWDTFIPEGQSLVPIQVANYESLDQIIGRYGVVDLLSTPLSPNEKPKRVAFAVKLLRSPKSRRHFSVLVPADEAHRLAGFHGEFTVVVRNPKLLGTKIVKEKSKGRKRQIVYEMEAP